MRTQFTILLCTLHSIACAGPALFTNEARTPQVASRRLRPAVEDDLDDIVTVFLDAFKPSAGWQYAHSHDDDYTDYTWTCTRQFFQGEWESLHPSRTFINVIAVPRDGGQHHDDNLRGESVVSFGVWNWMKPQEEVADSSFPFRPHQLHAAPGGKCSEHLDVNTTRAADLAQQLSLAVEKYIRNLTEPQLYLNLLATHPDWDGHGFGARQVEVGLKEATRVGMPVTLLASPAGWPLYDSLGFRSLANITHEMFDGLGTLWSEYMRWDEKESGVRSALIVQ
ncbi:hypothetical protein LTR91_002458 [Friedmanniomyces endolithicus]|uniref:N-acetyltransferase domain-containing protein n=1 Tax=Friedmanniomyces endolithicus TaxID=329885 RepID=A0A4U0UL41_9PEZI|nr:hypothetical protein LTS09_013311 [Friedmanniomyces endolithicus]KAK0312177.1 hypothetical protein LTR01_003091 [Friedmanniomyces endolithicus]KAK0321793.1 hypothetical protein LTR82_007279 [Friedmanniomyces endolithicus]KAK0832411.1 hypothetical protein LTR73_002698 [Friedmanniomyces endolithicus]KAK0919577.1 hypothetical protein LTR57_010574 [Friedmanniomyces endolithicus]